MRQDKIPTVMFTKKYEEPILHLHCAQHRSNRMVRLPDPLGLRCSCCGGNEIATMTKETVEGEET